MKNLGLSLVLVVLTAVIGLGWLITEIHYRNVGDERELSGALAAYHRIGRELALSLDGLEDKQELIRAWQGRSDFAIRLQPRIDFPVPEALAGEFQSSGSLVLQAETNVSLHFLLPVTGQVLSLVIPDELVLEERPLASLVLTLAFYACVIAILLIWLYPLIRRLHVLGTTARAFGQGALSARVTLNRFSYIGDIEVEFNSMADRIEILLDDNKLLSRAVSHNLKTPLARLRFGLDTLEETRDPALREKYGQRIGKDLNEMESLVETLLQYARLEESRVQVQHQRLDLAEFVTRLFEESARPGIGIRFDLATADTHIDSDPSYLAILLNNVMDNALKHARSTVKVTLTVSGGSINLSIEDDGEGIAAEDRAEVLKPFWRGKQEPAGGHGMGLAIVARIAAWFDMELRIDESAELGGTAVHLGFKKSRVDQMGR